MNEYWLEIARELLAERDTPGFHYPDNDHEIVRVEWIGKASALLKQVLRTSEAVDA